MNEAEWRILLARALDVPDAVTDTDAATRARLADRLWSTTPPRDSLDEKRRRDIVELVSSNLPRLASAGRLDRMLLGAETTQECADVLSLEIEHRLGTDRVAHALRVALDAVGDWVADPAHRFDMG